MFRTISVILLIFLVGCATSQKSNYKRFIGEGLSESEALQTAFIKAIEYEVGVLILSERESTNLNLIKNDIFAYSSGYVDDFKIVSKNKIGNRIYVTADISISDSKIKNRILGKPSSDKNFDGEKHNLQYKSYLNQRQNSDKLLDIVLNDFPKKAFNINQKSYSISYNSQRQAVLQIPFDFAWNHNYLAAVNDMLDSIKDVSGMFGDHQGYVITILKKPDEYFGTQRRYLFNDMSSIRRLNIHILEKEPMIKIIGYDLDKKVIHQSCISPKYYLNDRVGHEFYKINRDHTVLFGNIDIKNGAILLTFSNESLYILKKIYSIELSVVSKNNC